MRLESVGTRSFFCWLVLSLLVGEPNLPQQRVRKGTLGDLGVLLVRSLGSGCPWVGLRWFSQGLATCFEWLTKRNCGAASQLGHEHLFWSWCPSWLLLVWYQVPFGGVRACVRMNGRGRVRVHVSLCFFKLECVFSVGGPKLWAFFPWQASPSKITITLIKIT